MIKLAKIKNTYYIQSYIYFSLHLTLYSIDEKYLQVDNKINVAQKSIHTLFMMVQIKMC